MSIFIEASSAKEASERARLRDPESQTKVTKVSEGKYEVTSYYGPSGSSGPVHTYTEQHAGEIGLTPTQKGNLAKQYNMDSVESIIVGPGGEATITGTIKTVPEKPKEVPGNKPQIPMIHTFPGIFPPAPVNLGTRTDIYPEEKKEIPPSSIKPQPRPTAIGDPNIKYGIFAPIVSYSESATKAFFSGVETAPFEPSVKTSVSSGLPGLGEIEMQKPEWAEDVPKTIGGLIGYGASAAIWIAPVKIPKIFSKAKIPLESLNFAEESEAAAGKVRYGATTIIYGEGEIGEKLISGSYIPKPVKSALIPTGDELAGIAKTSEKVKGIQKPVEMKSYFKLKPEGDEFKVVMYSDMRYFPKAMANREDVAFLTKAKGSIDKDVVKIENTQSRIFRDTFGQRTLSGISASKTYGGISGSSILKISESEGGLIHVGSLSSDVIISGQKPDIMKRNAISAGLAAKNEYRGIKGYGELWAEGAYSKEDVTRLLNRKGFSESGQVRLGKIMQAEEYKGLHSELIGKSGLNKKLSAGKAVSAGNRPVSLLEREMGIASIPELNHKNLSLLKNLPKPIESGLPGKAVSAGKIVSLERESSTGILSGLKSGLKMKSSEKSGYAQGVKITGKSLLNLGTGMKTKEKTKQAEMVKLLSVQNLLSGQRQAQETRQAQKQKSELRILNILKIPVSLKQPISKIFGEGGSPHVPVPDIPMVLGRRKGAPLQWGHRKRKSGRKAGRRKTYIEKSILSDLLSVTESQLRFKGRATHPRPTKKVWASAERSGFLRVPTVEMMHSKFRKIRRRIL